MRQRFFGLLTLCLLAAVPPAQYVYALTPAVKTIQQSQNPSTSLSNQDVLALLKAELPIDVIIAKIKASDSQFDTSVETLKKMQADGVPGEIIMAMIVSGKRQGTAHESISPPPKVTIKIPAGTVVDFETAYAINSQEFRKGDAISFRVVNPVIVDGAVLIIQGATATGIVTKAERNGHWGRAGRITWMMKEVTAVDGSRVPIQFTGHSVGDSKGAKVALTTIAFGALMGPAAPIALFGGLKRGENAYIAPGKRYQATVAGEAKVTAYLMR